MRLIEKVWFKNHAAKWWLVPLLLPLTLLFWLISSCRLLLFKIGIKQSNKVDCPVIVVGNIGIGGNGKTPMVIYLAERLKRQGVNVGVLSRGYGSQAPHYPYLIHPNSTALEAGDEPLLISQRCHVPVVIGADRIAGAKALIAQGCNLIICDDGLQHYRLKRDYELLVIDGIRLFGNGLLLPAGPMRERKSRLKQVNRIIINGGASDDSKDILNSVACPKHKMSLEAQRVVNLYSGKEIALADFIQENNDVNAIAGIGDPQRFFDYLTVLTMNVVNQQGFIDHQVYNKALFDSFDNADHDGNVFPLIMTEKDAVKCTAFAQPHWWYLPVDGVFSSSDHEAIMADVMKLVGH